jgi:hypothetical protein
MMDKSSDKVIGDAEMEYNFNSEFAKSLYVDVSLKCESTKVIEEENCDENLDKEPYFFEEENVNKSDEDKEKLIWNNSITKNQVDFKNRSISL